MTQEEKELLLKDLSARLPYGVVCVGITYVLDDDGENYIPVKAKNTLTEIHNYKLETANVRLGLVSSCELETVKPYLRPMDSMTEEEYVYFMSIRGMNLRSYEIQEMMSENFSHPNRIVIVNTLGRYSHNIDWLNENMFDYRGLIERGLATEAPEGMYKIN